MASTVKKYLCEIGCCWRCSLIFLGETYGQNFEDGNEHGFYYNGGENLNNEDGICKRIKESLCCSCLSIMQLCSSQPILNRLAEIISGEGYDSLSFSLAVSLPICLGLRVHSIWCHLFKEFPDFYKDKLEIRKNHLGVLKDVCRNILGPKIGLKIAKSFISGQNANLSLMIHLDYGDNELECQLLDELNPQKFKSRRKCNKKYNEGVYTRQVIDQTLKEILDSEFLKICPDLPSEPKSPVTFTNTQCVHTSLYLAGRYRKFSRHLPQTPWIVEGERRLDSSVQECICEPILKEAVRADSMKFSASGREDVDVRCLGRGRPFVVEFLNPRRTQFSQEELTVVERSVNSSTDLINIRDLQIVSRKEISHLKDGEEEKTKSYCALCVIKDCDLDDTIISPLDLVHQLTIHQLTPIRVLHRRPLSSRQRVIHTMKAQIVHPHFFKLYLRTQAGTYIKEFVHGDLGRTTPNLGTLLRGLKVDIIALDVEDVQLDWPPIIEESS